ncbi:RNA polymerase, sigma 54 subunit, RpoN [mine drainage metagenome]|uniref:RNA polymerase, sigma 54 subunit, RpoN n=1 Tax=mine drainage metagenome TaxID=410659 RepID=T1CLU4_9ZZZZ
MKVQLQLKQTTQLSLTPQLQQSIRLLQLSTQELEQEVEEFLRLNPLLERADGKDGAVDSEPGAFETADSIETAEPSSSAEIEQESWNFEEGSGIGLGGQGEDEDEGIQDLRVIPLSLRDHLLGQVRLMPLEERDQELVATLIDYLDEDGYLRHSFIDLNSSVSDALGEVEESEWLVALRILQSLDPAGIGARTLSECLELQLLASHATDEDKRLGKKLLDHLEWLAQREYTRLKRVLGIEERKVRELQQMLLHFDPRPGAAFSTAETRYVVPDVIVRRTERGWSVSLNEGVMPRLRVNQVYANILKKGVPGHSMSQQLQEARWLIKNIQQRFDTILRVACAVVERQKDFLERGEVGMKPLVLREIAEVLGLHESTISRVTVQKYLLTPRGLFELKYFFSSHVGTDSGEAASSTAVRALIRQLINQEDIKSPLSDQRIANLLGERGFQVARRTVAKYREAMHLPAASLRKSL